MAHVQSNPFFCLPDDSKFIYQAIETWAPGRLFGDLDPETQSRVVLHAQQLKDHARKGGAQ